MGKGKTPTIRSKTPVKNFSKFQNQFTQYLCNETKLATAILWSHSNGVLTCEGCNIIFVNYFITEILGKLILELRKNLDRCFTTDGMLF